MADKTLLMLLHIYDQYIVNQEECVYRVIKYTGKLLAFVLLTSTFSLI